MRRFMPGMFLVGLAAAPALAQPATAPTPHKTHITVHRHPRHHLVRHTHAAAHPALQAAPVSRATPTEAEAPVPDLDREPPPNEVPPTTQLSGGNLQLHYPHIGDGYVPGSSSATMDDAHTDKVPGLTVTVPISQGAEQTPP